MFRTLEKSTAAESVVVAPLVAPVNVSPLVNVPTGKVIAIDVADGKLVIVAVAELLEPVIVSANEKLPEAATGIVKLPTTDLSRG